MSVRYAHFRKITCKLALGVFLADEVGDLQHAIGVLELRVAALLGPD